MNYIKSQLLSVSLLILLAFLLSACCSENKSTTKSATDCEDIVMIKLYEPDGRYYKYKESTSDVTVELDSLYNRVHIILATGEEIYFSGVYFIDYYNVCD